MKVFATVVLAALAVGQQFQQSQNYSPAVWIAQPGYYQQGGSRIGFSSSRNNNQFRSSSFQNNFQNQGANFRSGSFSVNRDSNQFGSSQNQNQFRFNSAGNPNQFQQSDSFRGDNRFQNNQGNRFQFGSENENRFQFSSSQDNNRNRFPSNSFQQSNQNNFQSGNFQQNNRNRNQNLFQSGSFQQNFQNQDSLNTFRSGNQNQFGNSQSQSRNFNNFQSNNFQQRDRNFQQDQSRFRSFGSFSDSQDGSFEPLNLPSGSSYVLGDISTSFSCANRPYGYYADQENNCRVFHVCNPSLFSNGEVQTYQYSFMCGEGTVFDQKALTCVKEFEASPCQEATNYYFRNEDFGRPEEKF